MLRITATKIKSDEEYKQNKEMQKYAEHMFERHFDKENKF